MASTLLVILPLLLYLPVLHFPFLLQFDDGIHVVANTYLAHPWHFWQGPYLGLYVPVTYSVWSLLAALSPARDPGLFHAANLVFHCLNGLLVFALLSALGLRTLAALAGALLFSLHPLQVEAVAWISALKDCLSTTAALGALLLYEKGRGRMGFGLATGAFLLAVLAKPSTIVLPLLAALLDRVRRRRVSWRLGIWCLIAVPIVLFTKRLQPDWQLGDVPGAVGRLFVAADAVTLSVAHLVFPFFLSVNYGRTPQFVLGHESRYLILVITVLIAVWLAGPGREKARIPALLYLAALLPTLGLIPFYYQHYSTVADRFSYLALLGPALGLALWLGGPSRPRAAGAVLVLVLLAWLTARQLFFWSGPVPLLGRMAQVNPSAESHYSLGVLLAREGNALAAERHYRAALRYNPRSAMAYNNLGAALEVQGRHTEALACYRVAVEILPELSAALNNLGVGLAGEGRLDEARSYFTRAVTSDPSFKDPRKNLSRLEVLMKDRDE